MKSRGATTINLFCSIEFIYFIVHKILIEKYCIIMKKKRISRIYTGNLVKLVINHLKFVEIDELMIIILDDKRLKRRQYLTLWYAVKSDNDILTKAWIASEHIGRINLCNVQEKQQEILRLYLWPLQAIISQGGSVSINQRTQVCLYHHKHIGNTHHR